MPFRFHNKYPQSYRIKAFFFLFFLYIAFLLGSMLYGSSSILNFSERSLDMLQFQDPVTSTTKQTQQSIKDPLDQLIDQTDIHSSLHRILTLLQQQQQSRTHYDLNNDIIDPEIETARCQKYGFEYKGRTKRRRIFFGSLLADDSWHTIATNAIEGYGLYHTVAFAESDVTTSDRGEFMQNRTLRFAEGSFDLSVMQSGIFGPSTQVYVDQYIDDPKKRTDEYGRIHYQQEHIQRDISLDRFRESGMTNEDVVIFADIDESFSRDFLVASQICEIPQFEPGQNCHKPKIVAKTLIFESAPDCISADRLWYHPDMMIGECVDEIGDSSIHTPGKRLFLDRGSRLEGYGRKPNDYANMPNTTMYPLWRPIDFRNTGGADGLTSDHHNHPIGFHFHNFFSSMKVMRHKYFTYGHANKDAFTMRLDETHNDLKMTLNCIRGIYDVKDPKQRPLEGGFDAIQGATPIAFQDAIYRKKRFMELGVMISEDERIVEQRRKDEKKAENLAGSVP